MSPNSPLLERGPATAPESYPEEALQRMSIVDLALGHLEDVCRMDYPALEPEKAAVPVETVGSAALDADSRATLKAMPFTKALTPEAARAMVDNAYAVREGSN